MNARLSWRALSLATGLWPIFVVHLAYLISAQAELVPWCFLYLDGCTSISRAARYGAANVWFKLAMLPYCVLLAAYWLRAAQLSAVQRLRWTRGLGLLAALFLALYATTLGIEGEAYQFMRRYGITVYFGGNVLALMLLASVFVREARVLTALCVLMLLLGLASIPLQHLFAAERDAAVNALEWTYALLMMLGHVAAAGLPGKLKTAGNASTALPPED